MNFEGLHLSDDFTGESRLFPLRDHVLYPGNVQQLHIFEPRYCEMLQEALDTDRLIAMATIQPDSDNENEFRPAIAPVVCIGRVAAHQLNADESHDMIREFALATMPVPRKGGFGPSTRRPTSGNQRL